jgi:hypothetical protein
MKKKPIPVKPELANHPKWQEWRAWIHHELGAQQNQWRIYFREDTPDAIIKEAAAFQCTCRCGGPMWPVRKTAWGRWEVCVTGERKQGHYRCFAGGWASARKQWLAMDLEVAEKAPRIIKAREIIRTEPSFFDDEEDLPNSRVRA